MKQTILAIAALLPLMATAQKTAEQYFSNVPTLTNAQIIDYHSCSNTPECDKIFAAIDNFRDKIKELKFELEQQKQLYTTEQSKKIDMSEANKVAAMSNTQVAAYAQQKANKQMASAGLSGVDMTKLLPQEVLEGKREMTAAEQKAMQDAMMKSVSAQAGISMSDIAALQNMSKAEQEAYIKKNGLANKAMAQRASKINYADAQSQVANTEKKLELLEKHEKAMAKYTATLKKLQAKEGTARIKTDAIWTAKYKANYSKITADMNKYWELSGEVQYTQEEKNAAKLYQATIVKRDELLKAYYTEAVPVWIAEMDAHLASIKNELLPAAREYMTARAKYYEILNNNVSLDSEELMTVDFYLDIVENKIIDFLNIEK